MGSQDAGRNLAHLPCPGIWVARSPECSTEGASGCVSSFQVGVLQGRHFLQYWMWFLLDTLLIFMHSGCRLGYLLLVCFVVVNVSIEEIMCLRSSLSLLSLPSVIWILACNHVATPASQAPVTVGTRHHSGIMYRTEFTGNGWLKVLCVGCSSGCHCWTMLVSRSRLLRELGGKCWLQLRHKLCPEMWTFPKWTTVQHTQYTAAEGLSISLTWRDVFHPWAGFIMVCHAGRNWSRKFAVLFHQATTSLIYNSVIK